MGIAYCALTARAFDRTSGLYVRYVGVTPYVKEQDEIFEAGRNGMRIRFTAFVDRSLPREVEERLGGDFTAIMREVRRRAEVRYKGLSVVEGDLYALLGEDPDTAILSFLRVWAEVGRKRRKTKIITVTAPGPGGHRLSLTLD